MKKIFTFFAFSFICLVVQAQLHSTKLSISIMENTASMITIDGNRYQLFNNSLTVNNLREGYHVVKIYRARNNRPGRRVGSHESSNQLLYSGNIYIKPKYHTDLIINRFGKAFTDEKYIYRNYEDDWSNNDWDNSDRNNSYENAAMNARSFEQFKQSLKNENFDNTRSTIAKQVIAVNYFTAQQVKEIAGLFSFDATRLDIAKFAYKNTVDKQNYFIVNDVFSFSSYKEELARYIQSNS